MIIGLVANYGKTKSITYEPNLSSQVTNKKYEINW